MYSWQQLTAKNDNKRMKSSKYIPLKFLPLIFNFLKLVIVQALSFAFEFFQNIKLNLYDFAAFCISFSWLEHLNLNFCFMSFLSVLNVSQEKTENF